MVAIADIPDFATPEQLEAYTKGAVPATDTRASDAIKAVTSSIRRRAGWHIGPQVTAHSLTLDGPGGTTLFLPTQRLVRITSLVEDATVGVTPTVLDPLVDLDSSPLGMVQRLDGKLWTRRYGRIQAVIDHGFDDLHELQMITCALVARGLSSPMGATREQAGSMSISWSEGQRGLAGGIAPSNHEQQIIDSYRLVI